MKSWYSIKAQAEQKAAEISVRGYIGEFGVTDRDLIAEVEALGKIENLTVRINSRGGDVDHGVAIFNYLSEHPAHVTTINEGVAMSCGSLILMAGDTIKVKSNSVTMIHNPWSFAAGNAKQLRAQADILEKFEAALASVYVARTGKSEEDIKAMLEGNDGDGMYMTAAEAKAEGFADEIEEISKKGASAMAMACALGIPESVLARIDATAGAEGGGAGDSNADPEPEDDHPLDAAAQQTAQIAEAAAKARAIDESIIAKAAAAGMTSHLDALLQNFSIKSLDDVDQVIAEAKEIVAVCQAGKLPEMAAPMIKAGVPLATVRARLSEARVALDMATAVNHHIPKPTNSPQSAVSIAGIYAARRTPN